MKVIWSPNALERLAEYAEYIALDNPIAAENWVNNILDKTELLSRNPNMGRRLPEFPDSNYRELIFGSYRVIYNSLEDINILAMRNVKQLLRKEHLN